MVNNGFFDENRRQQAKGWFHESLKGLLMDLLFKNEAMQKQLQVIEELVVKGERSPFQASKELIEAFLKARDLEM